MYFKIRLSTLLLVHIPAHIMVQLINRLSLIMRTLTVIQQKKDSHFQMQTATFAHVDGLLNSV